MIAGYTARTHERRVNDLAISVEPATGDYAYFEIKRGDMAEELGERLALARTDMTKMLEKRDLMVTKQEEKITVIKKGGAKTREALKGRIEEEIAGVRSEIIDLKAARIRDSYIELDVACVHRDVARDRFFFAASRCRPPTARHLPQEQPRHDGRVLVGATGWHKPALRPLRRNPRRGGIGQSTAF